MDSTLRIDPPDAPLRASPSQNKLALARLPAAHPVTPLSAPEGLWQRCGTTIDGHALEGFVLRSQLRAALAPEVDRLVAAAGAEYRAFGFGTRHETHPDSVQRIRDYWLSFRSTAEPVSVAWSAAFISFVVKQAALTRSFKFSGRHTEYLSDSKRALLDHDNSRAYWAVRLDEAVLRVGDLVGAFRTGDGCGTAPHGYDDLPGDFCAHCDLVVSIRDGKAQAIGGNVGQTVKVSELPLTPDGHVAAGGKRIVVMSRNF